MKSIKVLGMALLGMSIILASCSGEDGQTGPAGPTGPAGQGEKGDTGDKGDQGDPGEDKPNVDFYFQEGFKGYTGTADATISNINGDNGDNGIISQISFAEQAADREYHVMRFDDISEQITSSLVDEGESCADAFYVNQAILYVYVSYFLNDADLLYVKIGFYNQDDPLFVDSEAIWSKANSSTDWNAMGGESSDWSGPFNGTDDYAVQFNAGQGGSGSDSGWFPIQLPRSVVENWICDESTNKGMRFRLEGDNATNGSVLHFLSSENPNTDLRPLLVIETEDIDPAAGKMAPSGKAQDWDNMSYEEKMAPLYRYFAAKGL